MNTWFVSGLFFGVFLMKVELVKIKKSEMLFAWLMQRKGFKETLKKYKDYKTSPATEGLIHFSRHFLDNSIEAYWVLFNGTKAGILEIVNKPEYIKLARFCIFKKYRNKGIGQAALILAEKIYPDKKRWCLDTIFEEKNNVHLYEKFGYKEYGERKAINEKMTIIFYEKEKM